MKETKEPKVFIPIGLILINVVDVKNGLQMTPQSAHFPIGGRVQTVPTLMEIS